MSKYLGRSDAPFDERLWQLIDQTIVQAAKGQMSARRLLHVEGPFGLGLKELPGPDEVVDASEGGVTILASRPIPLATISAGFALARRDVAAFEETSLPIVLAPAAHAALACARQEDDILFNGSRALGTPGLLTAKGTQSTKLSDWTEVGAAVDDIIKAVTALDATGFHGPYALALAPDRFNLLYRRYQQGSMTEMDHLRQIAAGGVVKAPALHASGVLLATGRQFASIVLGQDLMAGFVGPSGDKYEFTVSESLALRLTCPEAVCVLK